MGALYPWTVVMGLHHMYNVIEAGMLAESGLNTWMPIASAANFAQFGACLAVGLKARSNKTKAIADKPDLTFLCIKHYGTCSHKVIVRLCRFLRIIFRNSLSSQPTEVGYRRVWSESF
jgi:hypothetical protein